MTGDLPVGDVGAVGGEPETFRPAPDARPDDVAWPEMLWPLPPDVVLPGRWITLAPTDPVRDVAGLFAALDHDVVWTHLRGRPADPVTLAADLTARIAAGWLPWTVRAARQVRGVAVGEVLGMSSYLEVAPADARLEIGATAYTPAAWGTAVNPECKLLLLGLAFEALGAGRVQLKTDVRNVRSQQAISRLGARPEGVLRRYPRRDDGTVRDTAMFSVVAEDWTDVRSGLEQRVKEYRG